MKPGKKGISLNLEQVRSDLVMMVCTDENSGESSSQV